MSKLIVKASRPRNPLVTAARFRHAGQHRAGDGGEGREARRALERELSTLDLPRDVRGKPPSL